MLYPQPAGSHCLNCMNCVRHIKLEVPTAAGAVKLYEDSPREHSAEIRCKLLYWGELPDGREKTYRSPWVAAKSDVLRRIAMRCPDYTTDTE